MPTLRKRTQRCIWACSQQGSKAEPNTLMTGYVRDDVTTVDQ